MSTEGVTEMGVHYSYIGMDEYPMTCSECGATVSSSEEAKRLHSQSHGQRNMEEPPS